MDYLQNHCWCSDSNWGGHYDCRHIVSLTNYKVHDVVDWESMTTTEPFFNEAEYERLKEMYPEREWNMEDFHQSAPTLKPEVFTWLHFNVEDKDGEKGWCIGSSNYRYTDSLGMSIFFQRRKDAMAFIRMWSVYKKPINYCQYFTDVRKVLNLETMKYEMV